MIAVARDAQGRFHRVDLRDVPSALLAPKPDHTGIRRFLEALAGRRLRGLYVASAR